MSTPQAPSARDLAEKSCVLGTHDAELERLGFQHSVWRDEVLQAWRNAGIREGARVIDVGAGPGFASLDLAELVGPRGAVLAVERSARFLSFLAEEAQRRGLRNISLAELDLMQSEIPTAPTNGNGMTAGFDAAWCRWVACFVPDPQLLANRFSAALASGGVAVFHEYVEYGSFQLLPPRSEIGEFVQAVFESWRAQAGEPDIARVLPMLLDHAGFAVQSVRPIARCARRQDRLWHWPAGFVRINVPRLVELGVRDAAWGRRVISAINEAEADDRSIFVTPTVPEIIAVKR